LDEKEAGSMAASRGSG